jgi:hypothetical protein
MPTVASSLKFILECEDEDMEDTLCTNFTVSEEVFGETVTTELIEGGKEIWVN